MLDFLRVPPRRFDLPVRLQRHELPSLISAAGFDLSCDLASARVGPKRTARLAQ